jgi:multiple sugar transport system substrate-binding protein
MTTMDRRSVLRLGGLGLAAAAAGPALAACGSDDDGGGSGGSGADLVLSTWNIPEDIKTYTKFAQDYMAAHQGVKIKVQVTPSGDFNQWFTTQLAANKAPDIIRMTYQTYGRYASNGALVKLDDDLPSGYSDGFVPSFWQAVKTDRGVFGLPQHTDTFATYYHKDIVEKAGVTPPTELDKAWTWDEFRDVARKVKSATGKYAFAYGFQGVNTAYRWLPILYMNGGKLLEDDLKTPAIDNDAGVAAIEFSRSWYADGLIPPSDTIKATQDGTADQLFTSKTVGMLIHGDWIMQNFGSLPAGSWDATYMIRNVGAASDLGGNVLAVTRSAGNKKVAADFVAFICNEQNMKYFCEHDLFLPVRQSLLSQQLSFVSNAPVMQRFVQQAGTVPEAMVRVETNPKFDPINQTLADQLDLCFTGQQSAAQTAKNIADGVRRALA